MIDAEGGSELTPGPPIEHCNDDLDTVQWFHNAFWKLVGELLPDDDNDEPFWMTEDAATLLACNTLFRN